MGPWIQFASAQVKSEETLSCGRASLYHMTMQHTYRRLCQGDRDIIHRLRQQGRSQTEIAEFIGFSPSAISRELKRNTGGRGYRPKQAGRFATARKAMQRRKQTIIGLLAIEVEARLHLLHSPEQICGAMRKDGWEAPSHEAI